MHPCPDCHATFSRKAARDSHVDVVHRGLPTSSCPHCEFKFGPGYDISSHAERCATRTERMRIAYLREHHGLRPLPKNLMKLASRDGWLDDLIIKDYLALACKGSRAIALDTLLFPSLQRKKLRSDVATAVIRRAKEEDPLSYDYVVIPVHLPAHWTVVLVDVGKKSLYFSDSLKLGGAARCLRLVQDFLLSLGGPTRWRLLELSSPRQRGGNDCGVFVCEVARRWVQGLPLDFSQEDIPQIRTRMVRELRSGALE